MGVLLDPFMSGLHSTSIMPWMYHICGPCVKWDKYSYKDTYKTRSLLPQLCCTQKIILKISLQCLRLFFQYALFRNRTPDFQRYSAAI